MSCRRFDELLESSAGAALEAPAQLEFDTHLAACARCAGELRSYLLTTELLRGLKPYEDAEVAAPLAPTAAERILALFAEEGRRRDRTG